MTIAAAMLLAGTGCAAQERDDGVQTGSGAGSGGVSDVGGETANNDASGTDPAPGTSTGGTDDGPDAGDDDDGLILDVASPDGGAAGDDSGSKGEGCKFIDVLFVVDISASMTQEKANLAANFPAFVTVLDQYVADGNALGYRLGVTNSSINAAYDGCTTTMGFDGALTATALFGGDCGTGGTPWLDGPAPDISANFSCLAENPIPPMGGSDCGHERPLGVMNRFVDAASGGTNDGFYRGEESLLVVVNLTDEDEDQAWTDTTPAETKASLDMFTGGEERYVAVTIAGPVACTSAFGDADEATVLKEFTALVPNGLFGDICEGDLAAPLADALDLIQMSCDQLPPPEG